MTDNLKRAIGVLKDYRKGDFVDDTDLCEAIDTVVEWAEKHLLTDDELALKISKSVCPKCGSDRWIKEGDYCECTECMTLFKQTVL